MRPNSKRKITEYFLKITSLTPFSNKLSKVKPNAKLIVSFLCLTEEAYFVKCLLKLSFVHVNVKGIFMYSESSR
jgi:hypothetical protein